MRQRKRYAPLPADKWQTVTVTLDTSAGRLTTYVDGVAVSSTETSIKAKDTTFTVEGKFKPGEVVKALLDAGFYVQVKK